MVAPHVQTRAGAVCSPAGQMPRRVSVEWLKVLDPMLAVPASVPQPRVGNPRIAKRSETWATVAISTGTTRELNVKSTMRHVVLVF